jgi:hypothetical protein
MVLTVGFPACLGPVAPDDGDGLEEGDKHQGDGGRVVVHQLEEVDPTLCIQRDVYSCFKIGGQIVLLYIFKSGKTY